MIFNFCNKVVRKNSECKFECKLIKEHEGKCNPFPFLDHLKKIEPRIADKIIQDSYHTRGNKTKPFKNRSFRWDKSITSAEAMKLKDKENIGIPQKEYSPQEECFKLARKLTRLIYEMEGAPSCPEEIVAHLDKVPDKEGDPCLCPLCLEKLKIADFSENVWGKAKVELWHINPLSEAEVRHTANNIGWGHRTCNIAQQERTTDETLSWMGKIIQKHKETKMKPKDIIN